MWGTVDPEEIRTRREELLREAEERRIARLVGVRSEVRVGGRGVVVRWGLEEDEERVLALLDLNGMPRWIAFEERFLVAEEDGEVVAALSYQTEPKRLTLGILVADPWRNERRLAVALYAGAKRLACELGATQVTARVAGWGSDYPREAGYRRRMGGWRWEVGRPKANEEACEVGRSGRFTSLLAMLHLPSRGEFRG